MVSCLIKRMAPVGKIFKAFLHNARSRRTVASGLDLKIRFAACKIGPPQIGERMELPQTWMGVQKYLQPKPGMVVPHETQGTGVPSSVIRGPTGRWFQISDRRHRDRFLPIRRKSDIFPPATVTNRSGPPPPMIHTRNPRDKSFSGPRLAQQRTRPPPSDQIEAGNSEK
jgi:hypothetical protein